MPILTIPTPEDFRFRATAESHGWIQLAPYRYDSENAILSRPYRLENGKLLGLTMQANAENQIVLEITGLETLDTATQAELELVVKRMFNLEHDLSKFYAFMAETRGYEWINEQKAARIFASPTIWEDLAKTLLTTNTTWGNTKAMAAKLVALDPDGCFPTPEIIASLAFEDFAARAGMGYRAAYLHDLAKNILAAEITPEDWRSLDSETLYKTIRAIKGYGDYAAGTMLRLLGHHQRLAIDSVARDSYYRITGQKAENDKVIQQHYENFGEWRGLVQWMDCIRY